MRFRAEFTMDAMFGPRVAQRAALAGDLVHVATKDDQTTVTLTFEATDHYTARSIALTVQGHADTTSRIRRDSAMFPGRWYDLNEETADA